MISQKSIPLDDFSISDCDEEETTPHYLSDNRRSAMHRLIKSFAQVITYRVKPDFDRESQRRIPEEKYDNSAKMFSELDRLLKLDGLTFESKMEIIRTPKRSNIRQFLKAYTKLAEVNPESLVTAFILLDRFLETTTWQLRPSNWKILLILSIRVAQKVEESPVLTFSDVHTLYPIYTPRDYHRLETLFAQLIDYRCYISRETFELYAKEMKLVPK
eukprot:CAMPEP_0114983286 /NCGR_PEP_ID=MMETSP0216-20121206/6608_1 /TAXON_ID=223996 /ORGANISM="Protocruzia adherens, Strain Boccale" /LENGTH=215 /DNA_ID=CAMNT_0002345237 /DNA_START=255 /DNA_END=902 /DNA_ORIENTATION=+